MCTENASGCNRGSLPLLNEAGWTPDSLCRGCKRKQRVASGPSLNIDHTRKLNAPRSSCQCCAHNDLAGPLMQIERRTAKPERSRTEMTIS